MGRRPIGGIFSVGLEEPYRWKDSVQSEPEIRLWVAEGTANGMRPWVTKFSGVLYDRRWLPVVERIYQWHFDARALPAQRGAARARGAAALRADRDVSTRASAQGDRAGDHVLGMYHALVEARVPFELVHEAFLTPDRLDAFKLLILADAAALSDAQCAAIRALRRARRQPPRHVRVVALRRARAAPRRLRPGRRVRRVVRRPHRRPDAELVSEPRRRSGDRPAASRSWTGSTTRRASSTACSASQVHADDGVPVAADADPDVSGPADGGRLPARRRTPTRASSTCATSARSRVVYIPWDIDRTFWDVMCVDHGRLLRNAVAWAANEPPPVEVDGPGLLDVTVWRQRESMTVHLVNLTNPMMMKGPLREIDSGRPAARRASACPRARARARCSC